MAFQRNAFQNNAFQVIDGGSGGGRKKQRLFVAPLHPDYLKNKKKIHRLKKNYEKLADYKLDGETKQKIISVVAPFTGLLAPGKIPQNVDFEALYYDKAELAKLMQVLQLIFQFLLKKKQDEELAIFLILMESI